MAPVGQQTQWLQCMIGLLGGLAGALAAVLLPQSHVGVSLPSPAPPSTLNSAGAPRSCCQSGGRRTVGGRWGAGWWLQAAVTMRITEMETPTFPLEACLFDCRAVQQPHLNRLFDARDLMLDQFEATRCQTGCAVPGGQQVPVGCSRRVLPALGSQLQYRCRMRITTLMHGTARSLERTFRKLHATFARKCSYARACKQRPCPLCRPADARLLPVSQCGIRSSTPRCGLHILCADAAPRVAGHSTGGNVALSWSSSAPHAPFAGRRQALMPHLGVGTALLGRTKSGTTTWRVCTVFKQGCSVVVHVPDRTEDGCLGA